MVATNAELMGETLNDIAEAIREKRGIYYDIGMLDFAAEIRLIQSVNDIIFVHIPFQGQAGTPDDDNVALPNVEKLVVPTGESDPVAYPTCTITVS